MPRLTTSRSAFANEGDDVAEVLAAHYLQAYRAAADDSDAVQLRTEAITALRRGAQRAAALVGAPQTAERAYRTAIELAAGEEEHIELLEVAGDMALVDGRYDVGSWSCSRMQRVGYEKSGTRNARRLPLASKIGHALRRNGRTSEAIELLMSGALALLSDARGHCDAAQINVELGVALLAAGRVPRGGRAAGARARARAGARPSARPGRRPDLQGAAVRRARPRRRGAHPVRRRDRTVPPVRAQRPADRRPAQQRRFPAEVRSARCRRSHKRRARHGPARRQPGVRERRGIEPDARVGVRGRVGRRRAARGRPARGSARASRRRVPPSGAGAAGAGARRSR